MSVKKKNLFSSGPKTFNGKVYKYAGFYSTSQLKHEKPFFKKAGYSIRALPHPQGSGYNVWARLED